MTKTFDTNANNDLYIGANGNLVIVEGILAVKDACANAAKTQIGEMVLDINQGIPNFQSIWVGKPNVSQFEAALRSTLLAVDGVLEVQSLIVLIVGDVLNYTANILTEFGKTELSGSLNGGI